MFRIYEADSKEPMKIWYCYKGGDPDPRMPAFIDDHNWNWVKTGREKFPAIKKEIENLIAAKHNVLDPYFNASLIGAGKWEVLNFYFWQQRDDANCKACPVLSEWLASIPGMTTAGVSRLSPNGEIKPHPGDTNAIARCHFGLSVPAGLPQCGIKVKDEERAWTEGDFLIFCDAFEHSAWNRTDQFRYVLIIDVVLPRFAAKTKSVTANVRSFLKLQELIGRKPWVEKLPGPVLGVIRHYLKWTL